MNSFKGQFKPTSNMRCDKCGRVFGPSTPLKMGYRQYGIAAGTFCNNTCCKEAFDEVVAAHPELLDQKGKDPEFHGVFTSINGSSH